MTDADVISRLKAAGVKARGKDGLWSATFRIDGDDVPTILFVVGDHFVALSVIEAPALKVPLERLPKAALVALLREGSSVALAKIEHGLVKEGPVYCAVSECSVEGWSGDELKRRLEATALLALRTQKALAAL